MQKHIFRTFAALAVLCILLLTAVFGLFYGFGVVFPAFLPAMAAVTAAALILTRFAAGVLTRKITKPLDSIDFQNGNKEIFYEEFLPFVRKIDRQKQEISQQLAALRSRADTIETITANMREGLVLLDLQGRILAANESVLQIFGRADKNDIMGKHVMHLYRDVEFVRAVEKCPDGEHTEMLISVGGRSYTVYLNPVHGKGAIIFFIDMTEQLKAESQRREFSANVSHELKTPLTTISALSEMMAGGMARPCDIADFAVKIGNQSRRLVNIIDDIIRLSEFDENKLESEFAAFDVCELAQSVLASLRDRAAERNITLTLEAPPMLLTANSRLIDELLCNLIDNGIKYNKDGGAVTVSIRPENSFCKITVSDTGIGIPAEHHTRVFERFYRVDKSRSKHTGGTGLGLSIVKHIAEHHKGKVTLNSAENAGTAVCVYIPE